MKIIITEDQVNSIKKIKTMEKYIDEVLSSCDWYEGIDKVSVERYILYRTKEAIPLYVFYIKTNDFVKSHYDSDSDNSNITEDVDELFTLLFPYDQSNNPTAAWVFRYVMP
jgi:hypothetical protein